MEHSAWVNMLLERVCDLYALANLEATRFALGRKNHIEVEINEKDLIDTITLLLEFPLGDHDVQDAIPEELEPFVAALHPPARVGGAAVGQGLPQERRIGEPIPDRLLELGRRGGDPEGARSILEEVLDEGDEAQRQQAQKLIDSLPD